ncbi:MAG: oligoendopeptidase F, partial [Mesorhizobium sp.]
MMFGQRLAATASGQAAAELGDLPEWNLADLYSGMEAPELKRDIARAASDAIAFEVRWKGTLAAEAERGAAGRLGEALKAYEALEELIGRIVSYAGLVYAGNTA